MDAAADTPDTRPPGQVLAEERERQGLSRIDVAQRLHMSPFQVEAMETGDYERLPRGPFMRGFVRNYAKLLGLDPEALLSQLADAAPQAPAPRIVVPSQNIRFEPMSDRLTNPYVKAGVLAVVVVALGFAAMYWWLFIRPTPPAAAVKRPAPEAAVPQNPAPPPVPPPEPVAPTQAPTAAEPAPAPAAATPAPAASASPSTTTAPATQPAALAAERPAGTGTLTFRFRGESWVEVRDARGEVIVSRLNEGGTELSARGTPPFSVIVGNAPEVEMRYNGRDFPLAPHTKVAVARFKVE